MKSIVLSQKAFASELFFAFTRERRYAFYDTEGEELESVDLFPSVTSHVFVMDFKVYDRALEDWRQVHHHGFSKSETRLNSIEGSDITEYIREQYLMALRDYQVNAGYLVNDQLILKANHPKFAEAQRKTEDYSKKHEPGTQTMSWMDALISVKTLIMDYGLSPKDVRLDKFQAQGFTEKHGKTAAGDNWYDYL